MKDGKMTAKELEVFEYVKNCGGKVSIEEIVAATGRTARSIGPNINAFAANDLAVREQVEVEGADKPVTYVVLTEAGMSFTPATDAE